MNVYESIYLDHINNLYYKNYTIGNLISDHTSSYEFNINKSNSKYKILPSGFDWRNHIELTEVQNQGNCGNCWAMSSTSSFSNRFRIADPIKYKHITFNSLATTVCVTGSYNINNKSYESNGCNGGSPEMCQKWFETHGASLYSKYCISWSDNCIYSNSKNCTNICNKSDCPNLNSNST